MAYDDVSSWSFVTWWLHAIGAYYLVNFFVYFARFKRLQARVAQGDVAALKRLQRLVKRFPGNGFAKMFGIRV